MTMVEKVARAIEPETFRRRDIAIQFLKSAGREWEGSPEQETHRVKIEQALARARSALEAMAAPTSKMCRAACAAMSPGKRPTPNRVSHKAKHAIRYRAMIQAALEEKQ